MLTMGRSIESLLGLAVFVAVAGLCAGSYIITTPRKWTSGETVQMCLFIAGKHEEAVIGTVTGALQDSVMVKVKGGLNDEEILSSVLSIPSGKKEACQSIVVPKVSFHKGKMEINGVVGSKVVSHKESINFATVSQTFVQTDKYLYKAGQKVKFRVLTINGPFLKIYTGEYPEIWIESPSGSRLAQWNNVNNPGGLIHEEFQLIEEPEEGTYKVHVESPVGGKKTVQNFKVEEFVLPRFEVTIEAPPYLLGSDDKISYEVCSTYTYGQPVKGNVTYEFTQKGFRSPSIVSEVHPIFGCKVFSFNVTKGVRSVGFTASVKEEGTGEEADAQNLIDVEKKALKFTVTGKEDYVKPNLPYTGEFKVTLPSGTPAAHEEMEICQSSIYCKNFTTDANGLVRYIYPKYEDLNIKISSPKYKRIENPTSQWRPFMFQSSSTHHADSYHSPSNSSLIIKTPEIKLKCKAGERQEFLVHVMYAGSQGTTVDFTIQLVSRGQIQYSHTQKHTFTETDLPIDPSLLLAPTPPPSRGVVRGSVNLPLIVPLRASPTAKVIVWYTRGDGEVVSDAQEIEIKKCFTNPVTLSWSAKKAAPGDEVTLDMTAAANSLCSLGVVDKSVELLSNNEDSLTLSQVFKVAEKAMVGETENTQIDDDEYCREKNPDGPSTTIRPPFFPWPPGPPGPPGIPDLPRPIPFAPEEPDDRRTKRSFRPHHGGYHTTEVDAIKMFEKAGLFVFTDLQVETRPCHYRQLFYYDRFFAMPFARPDKAIPAAMGPALASPGRVAVTAINMDMDYVLYSPEMTRGEPSETRSYFPETWLWELSILSTGNSSQALTLPHTITDWVGKAVCVHPVQGIGLSKKASITTFTSFFIDLTLPPSVHRGEILPVKISVFNYLQGSLPVRIVLEKSSEYDILENVASGLSNGTRSSCIPSQEKVVHTVKIRPKTIGDVNLTVEAFVDELFPEVCGSNYVISKRDRIIKPIRVELEGFEQEKTWSKYMCISDTGNEEQHMTVRMEAPSDIVQDSVRGWVTAVGDLMGPTLDNLGSLVKMPYGCGEQNMVNFAPNIFVMQYLEASGTTSSDIAEKAIKFMKSGYQRELRYRHKDGSFSAFGPSDESGSTWLTAFVVKSFAQAQQYIPIDTVDISMSRDWLVNTQMENGCFLSKGKVFHKAMKGGISGSDSPVPLTAYVLSALLEAGELRITKSISEAVFCLLSDKIEDPYTMALKSYALALTNATETSTILTQLINKAQVTTEGIYWEMPPSDGKSAAAGVETAAYVLLAMATLNPAEYLDTMQMVAKWISTKRNGQGGFVSTQDTVVALQALAKYETILGQSPVNAVVFTNSIGLDHVFRITETNKLLQQRVDVPSFPTTLTASLDGEGCALVQAVLRYNIPSEDPSTAFTLRTATKTYPDDSCVTKHIEVCASYTLPDLKSNMAVIEINLVSGYIPVKRHLKQVVGYGTGLVKRYEIDGRKVTFYIDEFSPEELCVDFAVRREVDVEDPKPGTVRVYDYYDPDQFVSKSYTLPPPEECVTSLELAAGLEDLIMVDV